MEATVKTLNIDQYERVIVTSDIHGDYEGFIKLLEIVKFTSKDCMILVGDILEKGKDSLKLLRRVMNEKNIFLVLGNNDTLFSDWKSGQVLPSDMLWYMNSRKNSIFIEMANELNCSYKTEDDIKILEDKIFSTYQNEINYLNNCPYILDTNIATFVHAGLDPNKDIYHQETEVCLTAPAFANSDTYFEKMIVVGHWPASNYSKSKITLNCYYNKSNNIMSIDGGNSMKSWQQINYLIFEDNKLKSYAFDRCEKIRCLESQNESSNPISLIFPNTSIVVKEKYEDDSLCFIPYLNLEMIIKNNHIYEYKRQTYCYDFTTYHLEIKENEIVSYCEIEDDGILIKKNGIVGLYKGKFEKL